MAYVRLVLTLSESDLWVYLLVIGLGFFITGDC